MGRIRLFPLLFQNGCSQSSRFLPQARRIVGSGDENVPSRLEVLREIALRLREPSVLPPFRERTQRFICLVNIFSNNLLSSTLEFLTTAKMPVRGSKHLDRKRKAAIALEVKVSEDTEVHCCGKWRQDWRFFVKDLRQLSSCYARRICKTSLKYG